MISYLPGQGGVAGLPAEQHASVVLSKRPRQFQASAQTCCPACLLPARLRSMISKCNAHPRHHKHIIGPLPRSLSKRSALHG